jgi:Fructose-bisphosphate aldolase class-I
MELVVLYLQKPGIGILQLSSIGVPNEEDNRRALREMLFSADGVENYISGVVCYALFSLIPKLFSCILAVWISFLSCGGCS